MPVTRLIGAFKWCQVRESVSETVPLPFASAQSASRRNWMSVKIHTWRSTRRDATAESFGTLMRWEL